MELWREMESAARKKKKKKKGSHFGTSCLSPEAKYVSFWLRLSTIEAYASFWHRFFYQPKHKIVFGFGCSMNRSIKVG